MKRGGWFVAGWALLATVLVGAEPDTRLVDAIRRADVDAVRKLIQQGVDVNRPQPDGATGPFDLGAMQLGSSGGDRDFAGGDALEGVDESLRRISFVEVTAHSG